MKMLVTVDEIENGKAALLLRGPNGEKPLGTFPLESLPAGVNVGDILSLSFEKEEGETAAARRRIRVLHKTLEK
ncbi:DUF3006 domain-containing protein [Methanocorpusculum labreanum]|uniref:DUF3006 domain-containing protein n=1 Tax=Methanocorpusculum labreanum TaxID=83984 RepID=UPI000322C4AF|nr:DUF3006 domain-containing protein [Methanocorpusculum labreanum]